MSDNPQNIPPEPSIRSEESVPVIVDKLADIPPPRLGIILFLAWITIDALLLGTSVWTNKQAYSSALEGTLSKLYLAMGVFQVASSYILTFCL
jgi:hypothetical protein